MPPKKAQKVLNLDSKTVTKADLVEEAVKLGIEKSEANKLKKDQLLKKLKQIRDKNPASAKKTNKRTTPKREKKEEEKIEGTNILKSDVKKFEQKLKELVKDEEGSDISSFSEKEEVVLPDFNRIAKEDLVNVHNQKKKVEKMNQEFIQEGYFLEINNKNFNKFVNIFHIPDTYANNWNFKRLLESLYLNYPQVKTLKESEVVICMKEAIKIYLTETCIVVIDGKMYVSSDAKWIVEKGWDSVSFDDTSPRIQITSLCINQARLRYNNFDTRLKSEQERDNKKEKVPAAAKKSSPKKEEKKEKLPDREMYTVTRHLITLKYKLGKMVDGKMKQIKKPTNEQDKAVNDFVSEVKDRNYDFLEAHVNSYEDNLYEIQGEVETDAADEKELQKEIDRVMANIPIKVRKDTIYLY